MIRIVIKGQIMGGKNNIVVTRTGLRFPKASWKKWRSDAVAQVRDQLPSGFVAFKDPVSVTMVYVAGDRRCRDMPAIIDAIWSVMETAGVVENDSLLWISESNRTYDKAIPGAWLTLEAEAKEDYGKITGAWDT